MKFVALKLLTIKNMIIGLWAALVISNILDFLSNCIFLNTLGEMIGKTQNQMS